MQQHRDNTDKQKRGQDFQKGEGQLKRMGAALFCRPKSGLPGKDSRKEPGKRLYKIEMLLLESFPGRLLHLMTQLGEACGPSRVAKPVGKQNQVNVITMWSV